MLDVTELLDRIIAAAGGEERLRQFRDVTTTGEVRFGARLAAAFFTEYYLAPNRLRVEIRFAGGTVTDAFDGEEAWETEGEYLREIDEVRFRVALLQHRLPLCLRGKISSLRYEGLSSVFFRPAHILEFLDEWDRPVRLAYETQGLTLLKYEGKSYSVTAETVAATLYSDYRTVDGYPVAFHTVELLDERVFQERFAQEVRINSGLKEALFRRPGAVS